MAYRQMEADAAEAGARPTFELVADCSQPPGKANFTMPAKAQHSGSWAVQQGPAHIQLASLGEPRQSWVISSRPCPEEPVNAPSQPEPPC